jgi:hypothetical protein
MNSKRIKLLTVVTLAFAAGWTGSTLSNGQINEGLVTALDSVLGNLLGETIAGATIGVANELIPATPAVQIDVDKHSPTPVLFNVFYPPDPVTPTCEVVMQVQVAGDQIRVIYDPHGDFIIEAGIINPEIVPAPCEDLAIIIEPPG